MKEETKELILSIMVGIIILCIIIYIAVLVLGSIEVPASFANVTEVLN